VRTLQRLRTCVWERNRSSPFDFAQGRLSTTLLPRISGRDDDSVGSGQDPSARRNPGLKSETPATHSLFCEPFRRAAGSTSGHGIMLVVFG
jgi:hypothetical protein